MFLVPVTSFGARTPPVANYIEDWDSTNDSSSYSFSSVSVAPYAGLCVVCAGGGNDASNRTLSSGTIGGSAATKIVSSASNMHAAGIITKQVTAGANMDVGISWSGGLYNCYITIYIITGLDAEDDSPYDTATALASSTTIDILDKGCVIAALMAQGTTGHTWTGVTEDSEQNNTDWPDSFTSGHVNTLAAQVGRTVSATGGSDHAIVAASW